LFLWLWIQVIRNPQRHTLKWAAISTFLVGLSYLPLAVSVIFQADERHRDYLRPFGLLEAYEFFLVYLSHGNTIRTIIPWVSAEFLWKQPWGFFLLEAFFAVLLLWGLVTVGRRWFPNPIIRFFDPSRSGDKNELLLFYFLVPPILLAIASLVRPKIFVERSMIILLPPFFVLWACGITALRNVWARRVLLAILLCLNCWSLFNLFVKKADTWTVWLPNPDWKGFAHDIRQDIESSLVFTNSKPLAMQHYLKDFKAHVTEMEISPNVDQQQLRAYIDAQFRDRAISVPQFFYVAIDKFWDTSPTRILNHRLIRRMYPLLQRTDYVALEVYKYSL
jgi:hypothetical protein